MKVFWSQRRRSGSGWRSGGRTPAWRCGLVDPRPAVAILPWGLLYDEDFLETIGVTLESFCAEMTGGYLFNYADALQLAGLRPIIVVVMRSVDRATRLTHAGTGAAVLALPAPARVRGVRSLTRTVQAAPMLRGSRGLGVLAEELSAYLTTPVRLLIRELRRERCAAILCQEYEYTRFDTCVAIGRRLGIPVFASFQGGNHAEGLLQRLIRPRTLRLCAGLIVGPQLEIRRVQERYGVPASKIARVFNPVDHDAFDATPQPAARAALDIPADARVVVWYGRVERHVKGLDVLLEAWQQICRDRPGVDLRLLMVGTGRDADWLRARIAASGIPGIRWRDEYIHDRRVLRRHLSAADVFVYPSRQEGFPVAPIEAMACGVPVVAAAAPGVPDILEGGEEAGGVVVAPGSVEQLTAALGRLLDDPAAAREIGSAGQARARTHFSVEAVGQQLRDFMVRRGLRMESTAHV